MQKVVLACRNTRIIVETNFHPIYNEDLPIFSETKQNVVVGRIFTFFVRW